jgi:hypothetical protein
VITKRVITGEVSMASKNRHKPKQWKKDKEWICDNWYIVVRSYEILNCPYAWKRNGKPTNRLYKHHMVVWLHCIPFDPETEEVHHKDNNPLNNTIDNLEVIPSGAHHLYTLI